VEAERFERNIHVIHHDDLSAYANRVASRVIAHLPPSDLKIGVILVDLPIVNAFSIAGGRIYVTRKVIAFVRNEDGD
jgi:predicted Zn-dependent protease